MRKADRETESRKLIGEKLREARMADNSPMTEADAEYYRILAEARATHASKENTRKSAKKHAFTSAAAILLILAVAGGSFILGMQSDVRASADPDDERKVVQQGDNIVIGNGVSEDDEHVGVVTVEYNDITDIPSNIIENNTILNVDGYEFSKMIVKTGINISSIETYYMSATTSDMVILSKTTGVEKTNLVGAVEENDSFLYNGVTIYTKKHNELKEYTYMCGNDKISIFVLGDMKIEAILKDLI